MTSPDHPLVTVVIPTYNYARYLPAALDSVLAQTYRNLEIILVDDGSTDDTMQRLEPYKARLRCIVQDNQGVVAARNTGLRAAAGELIAFLDADDAWHPRKLELQVSYLVSHPEVGMIAVDQSEDMGAPWIECDLRAGLPSRLMSFEEMLVRGGLNPSRVMVRKACFDAVGMFDAEVTGAEDKDMWLRVAARWPIALLQMPMLHYRVHGQNLSNRAALMEISAQRVLAKAFRDIPHLRGRWLLRRKARSYSYLSSAYAYDAAGLRRRALGKIFHSLLMWPLPLDRRYVRARFVRLKCLIVITLRVLGLAQPDRSQFGDAPPAVTALFARSTKSHGPA